MRRKSSANCDRPSPSVSRHTQLRVSGDAGSHPRASKSLLALKPWSSRRASKPSSRQSPSLSARKVLVFSVKELSCESGTPSPSLSSTRPSSPGPELSDSTTSDFITLREAKDE
ncbi:hypothetical protein ACLESD_05205 [Pyxidicoccus sp. 3LFB2]